ncbi:hypothetical protein [Iningainema tapete]|uniref:Uncharacterized protein n=1 Tax=Iningainema tapete BLCC-T55 TaxID=2748662 RepID=A0A8J7CBQ9_9CYAN|nr:hypothetical protein [Iningainema tapete]MBD2771900.1 hypothetical protein [Iningainema tapete BLCC-T55]
MENFSENLVAVEELLIAVQISDNDIVIIQGEAIVDLAEFNLTYQEVEKFRKIFMKINAKLAESFQEKYPASSVLSEIKLKSQ